MCVLCAQDGRDSAVAAAESGCPGADCCGHGGHHEGLQGKLSFKHLITETVMPVMVQREVILKAASILGKGTEIMKGLVKVAIFRIYLLTCSDHLVETCIFVFHCLFFPI